MIRDQAAKHNEGQKNKKPGERVLMNAAMRLEAIEKWGQGLSCQLELYARVGERVVLCGMTGNGAGAGADGSTGGASR